MFVASATGERRRKKAKETKRSHIGSGWTFLKNLPLPPGFSGSLSSPLFKNVTHFPPFSYLRPEEVLPPTVLPGKEKRECFV